MRKTEAKVDRKKDCLTVTAPSLAGLLDCGIAAARTIGNNAGAKIKVGRRTLYRLDAVQRYLEELSISED